AAEQLARTDAWGQHLVRRRVYVYLSSDPPDRFVRATVQASARGEPVLIVLPREIQVVSPTIRLGLRLAMPDVRPDRIVVRGGDLRRFEERLRRFPGGVVGVETDPGTLDRIAREHGMRVVSFAPGPNVPGTDRTLLVAQIAPAE
ncbi:MAG TPA: hypothetical protein VM779_07330, partial [Thermoanaerobaculia bacterium]|nr:hypothetical protein [Thermoanaerobaculia bacterium]